MLLMHPPSCTGAAHAVHGLPPAGRDAQVLDYVQFNRRAALNSALKHSACSYLPPKDAVPGADEAIHMYPFELSAQCEVLLLLASAPASALQCSDLAASGRLQFTVLARELGAQAAQVLDVDLAALLAAPAKQRAAGGDASPAAGTNPALSNGHQTMVVAAVYTVRVRRALAVGCRCHAAAEHARPLHTRLCRPAACLLVSTHRRLAVGRSALTAARLARTTGACCCRSCAACCSAGLRCLRRPRPLQQARGCGSRWSCAAGATQTPR
jgi:hypothetical protein